METGCRRDMHWNVSVGCEDAYALKHYLQFFFSQHKFLVWTKKDGDKSSLTPTEQKQSERHRSRGPNCLGRTDIVKLEGFYRYLVGVATCSDTVGVAILLRPRLA